MNVCVQLDPNVLKVVYKDLGLPLEGQPNIVLVDEDRGIINAEFDPRTNTIAVYVGKPRFSSQRLYSTVVGLRRSLLHEIRHSWQLWEWGVEKFVRSQVGTYEDRRVERDADQWADANVQRYSALLSVKPDARPMRVLP